MLDKRYDHLLVEANKYENWKKKGYFACGDKSKDPGAGSDGPQVGAALQASYYRAAVHGFGRRDQAGAEGRPGGDAPRPGQPAAATQYSKEQTFKRIVRLKGVKLGLLSTNKQYPSVPSSYSSIN